MPNAGDDCTACARSEQRWRLKLKCPTATEPTQCASYLTFYTKGSLENARHPQVETTKAISALRERRQVKRKGWLTGDADTSSARTRGGGRPTKPRGGDPNVRGSEQKLFESTFPDQLITYPKYRQSRVLKVMDNLVNVVVGAVMDASVYVIVLFADLDVIFKANLFHLTILA